MQYPKIFKFKDSGEQVRLASKMEEASRLLKRWVFSKEKTQMLFEINASGYAITKSGAYMTILYDFNPRKMDIDFHEIINAQ